MLKQTIISTIVISTFAGSAALAADPAATAPVPPTKPVVAPAAKMAPPTSPGNMPNGAMSHPAIPPIQTPEAMKLAMEKRKADVNDRVAKWNAMSKDDKVKLVNKQHEDLMKSVEARWTKLTDDEKIAEQQRSLDTAKKNLGI